MKKILALMLGVAMMFSGCASDADKPNPTAEELAQVVLDSVEFPETVALTDTTRITDELGISLDAVSDYAIIQQLLSQDVVEIIVLKTTDTALASEQLNARRDALKTLYAFYPQQVESANAAVVGVERDYAYLICHKDAAAAEAELISALS